MFEKASVKIKFRRRLPKGSFLVIHPYKGGRSRTCSRKRKTFPCDDFLKHDKLIIIFHFLSYNFIYKTRTFIP